MKNLFKIVLIILIAATIYLCVYSPQREILVLGYHSINESNYICSVNPELFEKQMKFLKEHGYTAISLNQFTQGLIDHSSLPPKPVLITFDDGYEDNYINALPIMEKYGMQGAEFIIVNNVGQPGYLTWKEISEMMNRTFEIASHTLSHKNLTELSFEEQRREIYLSKVLLEQHLQRPVEYIAYPYGSYNKDTLELVSNLGYKEAFSCMPGLNDATTNQYVIRRIPVLQPKAEILAFGWKELKVSFSKEVKGLFSQKL